MMTEVWLYLEQTSVQENAHVHTDKVNFYGGLKLAKPK